MDFFRKHLKGVIFFLLGMLLAYFLSINIWFQQFLLHLGSYGIIGAFFAGIFLASTFTVAIAVLVLIPLARYLSPIEISIIAGIGATVGNYIVFLIMTKKVKHHIHSFFRKGQHKKIQPYHLNPYIHWFIPFLAALIIASPIPDEIGVFLLSLFKMRTYQFLVLSFIFKFVGVFFLVSSFRYLTI